MDKINFSIIVPTYNCSKTISKALKSILHQTHTSFEILIIDGISSDDTLKIAQSYADERIKIYSELDKGIYDAMNKGILLAKGDWLLFLGGDDTLYNENILETISKISNLNEYDFIYGNVWLDRPQNPWGGKFNSYRFIFENLPHQAVFYKRKLFNEQGLYNLKYKILADKEFNLRIFHNLDIKRLYINEIVATFSGQGVSSTNEDMNFEKDKFYYYKKYINPAYRFLGNYRKKYPFSIVHRILMSQNLK